MGEGFSALEEQLGLLLAAYQALLVENAALRLRESELGEEVRRLGEARRVLDARLAGIDKPDKDRDALRRALLAGLDAALARLDGLLGAAVAQAPSSVEPPVERAAPPPTAAPVPFDIGRLERIPRMAVAAGEKAVSPAAAEDGRLF